MTLQETAAAIAHEVSSTETQRFNAAAWVAAVIKRGYFPFVEAGPGYRQAVLHCPESPEFPSSVCAYDFEDAALPMVTEAQEREIVLFLHRHIPKRLTPVSAPLWMQTMRSFDVAFKLRWNDGRRRYYVHVGCVSESGNCHSVRFLLADIVAKEKTASHVAGGFFEVLGRIIGAGNLAQVERVVAQNWSETQRIVQLEKNKRSARARHAAKKRWAKRPAKRAAARKAPAMKRAA